MSFFCEIITNNFQETRRIQCFQNEVQLITGTIVTTLSLSNVVLLLVSSSGYKRLCYDLSISGLTTTFLKMKRLLHIHQMMTTVVTVVWLVTNVRVRAIL